jgi:hypothetical protein
MLRTVKSLESFAIDATDGTIGQVKNCYFDDESWVVRYFVVDTSKWLGGREVLISPYSIGQPDWAGSILPAKISKQQVKDSPGIDSDKPVSRQFEESFLGYYGYPYYWGSVGLWGGGYYPADYIYGADVGGYSGYQGYLRAPSTAEGDPHLRSCNEVQGYHIKASDGEIGHVQGFLLDDATWSIRYLIVKTSNWWVGHQVLLSPEWINEVSWSNSQVVVSPDRQAIKNSPLYDADAPHFSRDEELKIYNHYGRNPYWQDKRDRAFAA